MEQNITKEQVDQIINLLRSIALEIHNLNVSINSAGSEIVRKMPNKEL